MRRWASSVLLGILVFTAARATAGAPGDASRSAEPVAQVGSKVILASELQAAAEGELMRLRAEEYEIKRRVLDEQIATMLLAEEAGRRKISVEELTRTEIDDKAGAVPDEELKAFYEKNKSRMGSMPEAEALKQVGSYLKRARLGRRREALLAELRQKTGVKVFLEAPRHALQIGPAASKGPADAPVTIVEYADFQCPPCGSVAPSIARLEQQYRGKVRVLFRDFPLQMHPEAPKAAEAAACAGEQNKFWEMHDKLFANQRSLKNEDLKRYAGELSLDAAAFATCLDSGSKSKVWQASMEEGQRHGVGGTPTIFVNGRLMSGVPSYEMLVETVEEELALAAQPKKTGAASAPAAAVAAR